jgi:hypothetical protein
MPRASALLLVGLLSRTIPTLLLLLLLLLLLDHTLLHQADMDQQASEHRDCIQVVEQQQQGHLLAMVSLYTPADLLPALRITTSSSSSIVQGPSAPITACRCRIRLRWLISQLPGSTRSRVMRHRCGRGVPAAAA